MKDEDNNTRTCWILKNLHKEIVETYYSLLKHITNPTELSQLNGYLKTKRRHPTIFVDMYNTVCNFEAGYEKVGFLDDDLLMGLLDGEYKRYTLSEVIRLIDSVKNNAKKMPSGGFCDLKENYAKLYGISRKRNMTDLATKVYAEGKIDYNKCFNLLVSLSHS